jgi:hypothetical protein
MFEYMQEQWAADAAQDAAFARLAAHLAELEQLAVGPALVVALFTLRGVAMDCTSAIRVAALWDRVISWAKAEWMIAGAEAVRGADLPSFLSGHDATQIVAQDLATLTHVTFATAMDRLALVSRIGRQLPLSWEALDRGDLRMAHLRALAKETAACTPRVAEAVDAQVIPAAIAKGWTPSQLGRAAARAVIAIDPEGAADRAAKAKADADVVLYPECDETASLVATGDALPLRSVMDTINARAAQMAREGDIRPLGQRRFAALTEYVLGVKNAARPPVEAVVTVDLTTLLGLTQRPGELSGFGPISPETARELAKDATLRRLVTDPMTGIMIDLGARYRPSPALGRIVNALHRTCRFPGCSRRAIECDGDHARSHRSGGATSTTNLHPLCRMHHNLKTHKRWMVELNPDGTETWTSPFGFVHHTPAATYPVEFLEPPPVDDMPEPNLYQLRQGDSDPPEAYLDLVS